MSAFLIRLHLTDINDVYGVGIKIYFNSEVVVSSPWVYGFWTCVRQNLTVAYTCDIEQENVEGTRERNSSHDMFLVIYFLEEGTIPPNVPRNTNTLYIY